MKQTDKKILKNAIKLKEKAAATFEKADERFFETCQKIVSRNKYMQSLYDKAMFSKELVRVENGLIGTWTRFDPKRIKRELLSFEVLEAGIECDYMLDLQNECIMFVYEAYYEVCAEHRTITLVDCSRIVHLGTFLDKHDMKEIIDKHMDSEGFYPPVIVSAQDDFVLRFIKWDYVREGA